jgi:lipopolysaccharide transport system permease protein
MSVIWALAQPMLPALMLGYLFSGTLAPQDVSVPYVLFLLAGLVPWSFLTLAITSGSGAFIGNASILTKVYFPRAVLPAASVLAFTLEFAGGCLVLLVWVIAAGLPIRPGWLALPGLFVATGLLAFMVSLGLGALNVLYRDVRHAVPFLLQVWLYATPVLYAPSLIPQRWHWVLGLNPMTGIVMGFRSALFGFPVDWPIILLSTGAAVATSVAGLVTFSRLDDELAERA